MYRIVKNKEKAFKHRETKQGVCIINYLINSLYLSINNASNDSLLTDKSLSIEQFITETRTVISVMNL